MRSARPQCSSRREPNCELNVTLDPTPPQPSSPRRGTARTSPFRFHAFFILLMCYFWKFRYFRGKVVDDKWESLRPGIGYGWTKKTSKAICDSHVKCSWCVWTCVSECTHWAIAHLTPGSYVSLLLIDYFNSLCLLFYYRANNRVDIILHYRPSFSSYYTLSLIRSTRSVPRRTLRVRQSSLGSKMGWNDIKYVFLVSKASVDSNLCFRRQVRRLWELAWWLRNGG